ncbi:hypothetical protein I4F81_000881 [Pyropia yezoensis]|uniref:Uncharacterized protein n=1 Tax=Pyropia yezoensis TaxID=2788 RepID=A0ACC3BK08_PYRYE|nr:hypothetical protein I4F81_000881 [Neopyropia yezoensis]
MATRRPPPPTSPDPPPAAAEEEDEGNQLEVGRVLPATGLFTVFRATLGRGDGDAAQPLDVAVKVLPIHRPAAGALLRELAPLAVAAVHPHLVPYVALFRRSRELASLRTPYIPIDVLTRVAVAAPADMGDHDADGVCAVGGSAAAGAGRFPPPRGAVEMALTAVAGAPAARSAAAGTSVAAASAAGMAEGADDAAVRVLLRMMHRMRH